MLRSLANTDVEVAPAVDVMYLRAGGSGHGGATGLRGGAGSQAGVPDEEVQSGLRRFTLMLGRLERRLTPAGIRRRARASSV